jgi:hypothetical protein
MDGADKAVAELERFSYARRADEVAWLRERIDDPALIDVFLLAADDFADIEQHSR